MIMQTIKSSAQIAYHFSFSNPLGDVETVENISKGNKVNYTNFGPNYLIQSINSIVLST